MFAKISRTAKTAGEAAGMSQSAAAMPPFWELEALIAQGFDVSGALTIMAQRYSPGEIPVILSSDGANKSERDVPVRLSA